MVEKPSLDETFTERGTLWRLIRTYGILVRCNFPYFHLFASPIPPPVPGSGEVWMTPRGVRQNMVCFPIMANGHFRTWDLYAHCKDVQYFRILYHVLTAANMSNQQNYGNTI